MPKLGSTSLYGKYLQVLRGVSIEARPGRMVAVLGPNGALVFPARALVGGVGGKVVQACSAATLRRRLEQRHGTRYSDLVDELKREIATRHLQERELRINEIARRVGFTQTAPLYRAFQRWYGCTPNEYRSLRGWLR